MAKRVRDHWGTPLEVTVLVLQLKFGGKVC